MTVLLAALAVPDPTQMQAMEEYLAKGPPKLLEAGGRPKFRAKVTEVITGETAPAMMFLAEYDSVEAVKAAFEQPEYQAAVPSRDKAFKSLNIVVMEEI